jgi:predicted DNA-binding transcriptional regulator AlpA
VFSIDIVYQYVHHTPVKTLAQALLHDVTNKNMKAQESQLVNLTQAAALCGISRQTLYYHLTNDSRLRCRRITGKPFFHPDELQAWNADRNKRKKRPA